MSLLWKTSFKNQMKTLTFRTENIYGRTDEEKRSTDGMF